MHLGHFHILCVFPFSITHFNQMHTLNLYLSTTSISIHIYTSIYVLEVYIFFSYLEEYTFRVAAGGKGLFMINKRISLPTDAFSAGR